MEWHVTLKDSPPQTYVYKVEYSFANPGEWVFTYLDVPHCSPLSYTAVVGIQGDQNSKYSICGLFDRLVYRLTYNSVEWLA
jgi:hypothetical protein